MKRAGRVKNSGNVVGNVCNVCSNCIVLIIEDCMIEFSRR